jgi:predicted MFS family arabinose efflux permease
MPVSTYRDLLNVPSLPKLLTMSVIGRANQGMNGLALLMLITERSSYAAAGLLSVFFVAGSLVAGPVLSRLSDVHGRRRVLALSAMVYAATIETMTIVPVRAVVLAPLMTAAGLVTPPVTAAIRSALPALVEPGRRPNVFALEATVQELIFVIGPPATAGLAAVGGPRVALATSGFLVLCGALGLATDRSIEAGRHAGPRLAGGRVLRAPGVLAVIGAGALLVSAFTGEGLGVVALVSGAHATAQAGLPLACGSLGSLVGGLLYGSRSRHRAELRHLMLAVAAAFTLLILAPNPAVLTPLLFCWGMTVAPAMSRLLHRLSSLAPAEAATEAFGWMASAFTLGTAAGSAVNGILVTQFGGRAALVAGAAFALLAALMCEPWPSLGRQPA